jgi:CRISPR-associated endonuclease Cas1
MNPDTDQLYGRIQNRVLTLSGNNPSIRVANGLLVIQDGPTAWVGPGEAPPVEQRMTTLRIARGERSINHIIVLRPTGFYTGNALQWMHDTGIAFTQFTFDGEVVFSTGPAGTDQPSLRRAQALASGNKTGFAVMKQILHRKLIGQSQVARMLPNGAEAATGIDRFSDALADAHSIKSVLAAEAAAAALYFSCCSTLPIRFARRDRVPEGWLVFGSRHSTLTSRPQNAVTPANAILNFLYRVAESQLTIALIGVGLDAGVAIFHSDRDRRRSLALDALESVRSFVDAWLLHWLAEARFARRDFHETSDGTIRITRPLSSHLAMTAVIWHRAAESVAGWLREALATLTEAEVRQLPPPLPYFPTPRRPWAGMTSPIPKMCIECGAALPPARRRFCSTECAMAWHLATAPPAETPATPLDGREKTRQHLAARRRWDALHTPGEGVWRGRSRRPSPSHDRLRRIYKETIAPKVATLTMSPIALAEELGVSRRYIQMIRAGYIPHPRHFEKLAKLAGVASSSGVNMLSKGGGSR